MEDLMGYGPCNTKDVAGICTSFPAKVSKYHVVYSTAAFGHRIPPGPEMDAWAAAVRYAIGPEPRRVLELACGTGEVTNVLLSSVMR